MKSFNLNAKQKAAILLTSLPPEVSAQILKELGTSPEELSDEVAQVKNLPSDVKEGVLNEFLKESGIMEVSESGELTFESPFTKAQAEELTLEGTKKQKALDFLHRIDSQQLLTVIHKEHPQTIALILSHLPHSKVSSILAELPKELQADVTRRLVDLGKIDSEILQELEKALEDRIYALLEGEYEPSKGKEALIEILSQTDQKTEEKIISDLSKESPKLARDLQTRLYEFEDLAKIDIPSLKQVLRLVDLSDLTLALKNTTSALAERIYKALPTDTAEALKRDVQEFGFASPIQIKTAKVQIRNILRGLATLGKIRFIK